MTPWSSAAVVTDGRAQIPEDWAQGRSAFGGLLAALGLRALEAHVPADRPLRSAVLTFPSPLAPGEVSVEARVLRAGRAIVHAEARVSQGDALGAVLLGAFGAGRPTRLAPSATPPPGAPPDDGTLALSDIEGAPRFTRHFAYRWEGGRLPYTGQPTGGVGGWVRLREDAPVGAAEILALVDAWPPPVLPMLDRPAPASTVTWMIDLTGAPARGWLRFASEVGFTGEGYADVTARLWNAEGALVATSHQLVAEFSAS